MHVCTLRWLVSKLQEPVKTFPYAWPVFFRLTAFNRLDRLPLVFIAGSITTVRPRMRIESERGQKEAGFVIFHHLVFLRRLLAWLNQ